MNGRHEMGKLLVVADSGRPVYKTLVFKNDNYSQYVIVISHIAALR